MIPPSAGQVICEESVSNGAPFSLECCDVVAGSHERVAAALAHLQPAKTKAATTTAAMMAAISQPGPGTHIQAPTAKVATPAMAPAAKATLPAQIKLDFV